MTRVGRPKGDWAEAFDALVMSEPNGRHAESTAPQYRLWTIADLAELRPPSWRIDHVLPDTALAVLFGVQSTYKSFVALAWGLSIASGVPWLGHHAELGNVVYVAAEGGPGLLKRVCAWQAVHRDADPSGFRVVPHPVDLRDASSVEQLRNALRRQLDAAPALVVVDTWSRSMPGANENSVEDTSAAVGKLDAIRREFSTGVLVVHHAGLEAGRERGSTALGYAADCRWETCGQPNAPTVTLRNHKQKDWSPSPPLALRPHDVGEGDDASLVLRLDEDTCRDHNRVVSALKDAGTVTQTTLVGLLTGSKPARLALAKAAAACHRCPVDSWRGTRNQVMYSHRDESGVIVESCGRGGAASLGSGGVGVGVAAFL